MILNLSITFFIFIFFLFLDPESEFGSSWIIYDISVFFFCFAFARLFINALVTCWERADLLALL